MVWCGSRGAAGGTAWACPSTAPRAWLTADTRIFRFSSTTFRAPPWQPCGEGGPGGGSRAPDPMSEISWSDFERVDMRVGTVMRAEPFPEARKPAYKLWIDLGPLGERRSSAQITDRYRPEDLIGRQVVCVVNFPPKRVGPFVSEVLVLGAYVDGGQTVVLLRPDQDVERGSRIG